MKNSYFAALFGLYEGEVTPTYEQRKLSVEEHSKINVLAQPRKTFDQEALEILGISISNSGLMKPILFVEFYKRKECADYLGVVNEIWKTNYKLSDLRLTQEKGKRFYRILVAGERRYRAIGIALKNGSYKYKTISVSIATNATPFRAVFLQWEENSHLPVPAHEDAAATAELFKIVKKARPSMSKAKFSRLIGRSYGMVLNALRFSDLPLSIQSMVEDGTIRYGIALELARLRENGVTHAGLLGWSKDVLVENLSVERFHLRVSTYIEHKRNGQQSLLDMMSENSKKLERQLRHRKVVQKSVIRFLWAEYDYFCVVLKLFEEKQLGLEDSPFSEGSPIRHLLALVGTLERLDKHLGKVLSKKKRARVKTVVKKVGKTAKKLLDEVENVA